MCKYLLQNLTTPLGLSNVRRVVVPANTLLSELPLDEGYRHLMKIFQDGSLALGCLCHLRATRSDCREEGVDHLCDRNTTPDRELLLKLTWARVAHRSLSPGWRTALCTAGSRSSSNIITLFLPCLYLLLPTLQSSLSQRGSLGCLYILSSQLQMQLPCPKFRADPQN